MPSPPSLTNYVSHECPQKTNKIKYNENWRSESARGGVRCGELKIRPDLYTWSAVLDPRHWAYLYIATGVAIVQYNRE